MAEVNHRTNEELPSLEGERGGICIIIGSGLGGLECARVLASQGRRLIVLEREQQPGGCMQSYRRGAFAFDTGLHYVGGLGEGQSLHDAFERLGLLRLPWVRLDRDGFDHVTIAGRTFKIAEGYDNFVETLARDFPSEREALVRYVDMMRKSESRDAATTQQLVATNAWQWLSTNFSDELLANVVSGAAMKLELRKETLPLFTFLHCNSSYIQSAWRLKGDGNMIVASLINDIRRLGGQIVCNAEVTELVEHDGRIVEAVCKDGRRYAGETFISDVHPSLTCSWVRESIKIKKIYRRRMSELQNTTGMFTVSLVLKPHALRYFNHNDYVYRNADVWDFYRKKGPVGGVMVSCRVPDDGGEWAQQVDILTPMTWEEVEPWSNSTVGRRPEGYRAMKQRRADECIELAETVLPGLRNAVERMYTSTPLTYRDYTLTPDGSAFGVRKDCNNPLMTQLSAHTPVPNLLLTGQSLVLHGLQGVTMTAMETAKECL